MTDLYEQIKGDRGRIESFVGKIPGYKGYKEKEMRREADKMLREALARRLEEQWRRLPDIQKQLLSGGQIQWLDDIEGATIASRPPLTATPAFLTPCGSKKTSWTGSTTLTWP